MGNIAFREEKMTTDETVATLESRLKLLESRVWSSNTESECGELVDDIHNIRKKLYNAALGKEKIQSLWKRMDELKFCLDPESIEKMTIFEDAKADIILNDEAHLREQAKQLEEVEQLKDVLDSDHLKVSSNSTDRLQPLITVQVDQQDKAVKLDEETRKLLEAYNNIISMVSKQFVLWDETITAQEIKQKLRKNEYEYL
ncbi:dynactin subunit 3-like [Anneissia japonica]|uniref:dynactin subunit 3-like n=1 Tax=Anneissia japonica TaxID=1529436 RepID=UPI0014255C39|nr:dynactin subunit 3-like [Anneissia japonica]